MINRKLIKEAIRRELLKESNVVNVKDIPNRLGKNFILTSNEKYYSIYNEDSYNWWFDNKQEYEEFEKELSDFEINGNGWSVNIGFDVSGFEYWVKEVSNWAQPSISLTKEMYTEEEFGLMKSAFEEADYIASKYQHKINYDALN